MARYWLVCSLDLAAAIAALGRRRRRWPLTNPVMAVGVAGGAPGGP